MAIKSQGVSNLDYDVFWKRVDGEAFAGQQIASLKLRFELFESFIDRPSKAEKRQQAPIFPDTKIEKKTRTKWLIQIAQERSIEKKSVNNAWNFEPEILTIIDLNCFFIDESSVCALFSICLDLFLERRNTASRIVAFDETHKVETAFPTPFTPSRNWVRLITSFNSWNLQSQQLFSSINCSSSSANSVTLQPESSFQPRSPLSRHAFWTCAR